MFDKSYFRSRGIQSIPNGFSMVMVNVKKVLIYKSVYWLFGKFITCDILFLKDVYCGL